jgi:hypothetical protein
MSNYVVPGANPNTSNDIDSIGAATPNVTITGTGINPLIGVTQGGVLSVENVTGNVNLNGVGIVITTAGSDVTLTAPVKKRRGWILKDRIYPRERITTELTEWTKFLRGNSGRWKHREGEHFNGSNSQVSIP